MTKLRRLFGTDGIRGKANTDPMTAGIALRLGQAAGLLFTRGNHRHRVVIGKDTRLSGYMLEPALTAGFIGAGMDVTLLGPLPTPAIAMLTRSPARRPRRDDLRLAQPVRGQRHQAVRPRRRQTLRRDRGRDRGADGQRPLPPPRRPGQRWAAPRAWMDAAGRYIEAAKASFPRGLRLDDLRIVRRLRQRRRLPRRPDRAVGAGRHRHPDRRRAGRLQHQQGLRLHRAGVSLRRRCWSMARISASRWTATPTA